MATTSIWAVKGWLGKVVIYVENPEKTRNPGFYKQDKLTDRQTQGLMDVIAYATRSNKTMLDDERAEIKRQFVSAINCQVETARDEMNTVKKHFGKTEGVVAYHGYQSFAPGEATPELAHEIGMKLAERLWGDMYQVIVTTHLDKAHHLHNHFVLNNVSMVDGKKYHRTRQDYVAMQRESDALCREYGLSVIDKPEPGKAKHYTEWQAERDGRQTWRGMVKTDVDTAIRESMTERQFWDNLRKKGYEVKYGKDISVRPPGKERYVRLRRNFGDAYTVESIRLRILAQRQPERIIIPAATPPRKARLVGNIHKAKKVTGLRALYFYYLYRMGVLPRKRRPNPKRVYFLFREDIRFIQNISRETRLLAKYGIDTVEQLSAHKASVTAQMNDQYNARRLLRNKARSISVKSEISKLSEQIGDLRREVRLCEDIAVRSGVMREKLRKAREDEKSKAKDVKKDDPFRRRR